MHAYWESFKIGFGPGIGKKFHMHSCFSSSSVSLTFIRTRFSHLSGSPSIQRFTKFGSHFSLQLSGSQDRSLHYNSNLASDCLYICLSPIIRPLRQCERELFLRFLLQSIFTPVASSPVTAVSPSPLVVIAVITYRLAVSTSSIATTDRYFIIFGY